MLQVHWHILVLTLFRFFFGCSCDSGGVGDYDFLVDKEDAFILLNDFKGNISIGKNGYNFYETWVADNYCDTWYGVTCDIPWSGKVTGIYLFSNDLRGSIPSSLGKLSELKDIYLDNNSLTGSIPTTFGTELTLLRSVFLSHNLLTGSIPTTWGTVSTGFSELDLSHNLLTGNIPNALDSLAHGPFDSILDLSHNLLTGSIPVTLRASMFRNGILDLSHNLLTARIPDTLGGTKVSSRATLSLIRLDLSHNLLSGSVPATFGNFGHILKEINLSYNFLSGSLPATVETLTGLQALYLQSNYFINGVKPLNTSTVRYKNFNSNCFTKAINQKPRALCSNFCDVYQKGGPCGGHGRCTQQNVPKCICDSGYGNKANAVACVKSPLMDQRDSFILLNDFRSNIMDGSKYQFVYRTWGKYVSCEIWKGVSCDSKGRVIEIDLSSSLLIGRIPSTLSGLTSLRKLDLSNNSLKGSIPSTLSHLSLLQYLDVSNNALRGSIPSDLGTLSSLHTINLNNNALSGAIPSSLGSLTSLLYLRLNSNELSGIIPSTFNRLRNLRLLYLNNNFLISTKNPVDLSKVQLKNFNSNCFSYSANQKPRFACSAFCNVYQKGGPCSGHGICKMQNSVPTCSCDSGYINLASAFVCAKI